ncbi:aquaporin-like protein [Peniophora sp. CONT]|nr:aquaporin-like protein [Peniophora sp. CONT]
MAGHSQHNPIHLADSDPRPLFLQRWERIRHRQAHLLVELVAEFWGVFCYVFAGVGATASYICGNTLQVTNLGSFFTIGIGYAIGIVFALVVAAPTSGGHFNPTITICFVLFKGFPKRKALAYICAQILGGMIACLLVYAQWYDMIKETELALASVGKLDALMFTASGPSGIFALYAPVGANMGLVFLNEFVCDFFIGMVIFAATDPTNYMSPPAAAPWIIGFVYAVCVWGFAPLGLAANTARDLGGRLAAMIIFGRQANGGTYAAIAALTNIVATPLAFIFYEIFFKDSSRVLTHAAAEMHNGHKLHQEHSLNVAGRGPVVQSADSELGEKSYESHREYAS